jgi:hypothetical protein
MSPSCFDSIRFGSEYRFIRWFGGLGETHRRHFGTFLIHCGRGLQAADETGLLNSNAVKHDHDERFHA